MQIHLIDRSTGQRRALDLTSYLGLPAGALGGYFTCYSESGAYCQQRAVFQGIAKISLAQSAQHAQDAKL